MHDMAGEMMEQEGLFKSLETAKHLGSNRKRAHHALRIYSERGLTLKYISGPKILNKSLDTLKKYCREAGVKFPDYIPMSMRPKAKLDL